ncbi:MAG: ABC transporter permease [Chloroflexi bacterium]|nr:ABC transporter permease [Chloroflexota bacterium]
MTAHPERAPVSVRRLAMMNALPLGFVGLIVLFVAMGAPNFLTFGNVSDILRLSAPIMVVAIPLAFLLIMGHVDLSIGSTVALSAVVLGLLITRLGLDIWVAALGGVLTGVIVGCFNGLAVTRAGLSPIIVTLGTLTGIRGIAMWLAPGSIYGFGSEFVQIGYGGILGIPYFVLVELVVACIGAFVLAWSPIGRHVLAIGVNEQAAYLSGVKVQWVVLAGYIVTGMAAGLAGVMYAMLLNSAPAGTLGLGFELEVLTAVMLGGVAFSGGRGTIRGVVLGVLFLAVLKNGLILLNIQAAIASVIMGAALLVSALLDRATVRALLGSRAR